MHAAASVAASFLRRIYVMAPSKFKDIGKKAEDTLCGDDKCESKCEVKTKAKGLVSPVPVRAGPLPRLEPSVTVSCTSLFASDANMPVCGWSH